MSESLSQALLKQELLRRLAWLKNESRKPGEMEGLAEVAWMADRNEANILTSVITKGEILQSSLSSAAQQQLIDIFKRPNIVAVDLTNPVAELSGVIRDYYVSRSQKMMLPDAQHLATAIAHKVTEFHTFDENDLITKKWPCRWTQTHYL